MANYIDHINKNATRFEVASRPIADSIAEEFSTSRTYAVGDYVMREYKLYKCISAVTTAGSWVANKWQECKITNEFQEIANEVEDNLWLLEDEIPDTTQTYTFSGGSVSQVIHSRNGTPIRTDAFTYETSTITEIRTLNTGEFLTIVTNLITLETTVTYSAA